MKVLQIPNFENMKIDIENVPKEYYWSGYSRNKEDFEEKNFKKVTVDNHKVLVCSEENTIALCDYISNELLKLRMIWDMECITSPGYDQWFFLKWEQALDYLEDMPVWIQKLVGYCIDNRLIYVTSISDEKYYVIVDPESISVSEGFVLELSRLLRDCALEYWESCFEDYEDLSEIPEPEGSEWGLAIYREFCAKHSVKNSGNE